MITIMVRNLKFKYKGKMSLRVNGESLFVSGQEANEKSEDELITSSGRIHDVFLLNDIKSIVGE